MEIGSAGRRKPRPRASSALVETLAMARVSKMGLSAWNRSRSSRARGVFIGANDHLLRAAARGDQADAGFDQADVGLGGGLDARAVQADFAAAAERQALRRDDDGARRVLERQIGVLELAHGQVQVVPFLLLRGDEQQQEIGAGGKIRRPGWRRPWRRNSEPRRFTPAWIMAAMSSPMAFILA